MPARFRVPPRPGGIAPFRDSLGRITSGEFGNSPEPRDGGQAPGVLHHVMGRGTQEQKLPGILGLPLHV